MIDRRDISYTQGSYLTPVHEGRLTDHRWRGDSTPDIASGDIISRAAESESDYIKGHKTKLQSPFPLPIINQFPYIEFEGTEVTGMGVVPVQDLFLEEPEPEEVIIYPSPFIPIEPKIGEDVPEDFVALMDDKFDGTIGTPFPVIADPISLELPDVGGWFGDLFENLKGLLPIAVIGVVAYLVLRKK